MRIPADLQPIVDRALQSAFGTTTYDAIAPLTGGMRSPLACRIVVHGRAYALRIGATTLIDPAVELANTRAGADAGLAPRIHHANPADRVVIADFIARAPLPVRFAPVLAATIARVHALPPWPKTIHHFDMLDRFLAKLRDTNVRDDLTDVLTRYADVAAIYPRDVDVVACHNDLKPQNILYDGTRVWLVDWEAAFGNDRYADLAMSANFFVASDVDEHDYLAAYFRAPPTDYQRARFFLARFAQHLSYMAFLSLTVARSQVPAQPTPDWRAFHEGLLADAIDLNDDALKLQYANVHLAAARRAIESPRFAASLTAVAGQRR